MKLFRMIVLCFVSIFASFAQAGEVKPYDQAVFDALASEGKSVVLAVHADWCPTCRAQRPIQESLMMKPEYRDVTLMIIDFDKQGDLLKKYKVGMQSTMIGFKGGKEVGRSVGDTNEKSIEALIVKTQE